MNMVEKLKFQIKNSKGFSFADMEEFFEREKFNYKGDVAQVLDPLGDTYIWAGWNDEAWKVVDAVIDHRHYGYVVCSSSVYLMKGRYSKDPIAHKARKYSKTHWLPVLIVYSKSNNPNKHNKALF
jgi:hypothetical protein